MRESHVNSCVMIQPRKWACPKCMKTCLIFVCLEFRHFHIIILLQYIHIIVSRFYQASNSNQREVDIISQVKPKEFSKPRLPLPNNLENSADQDILFSQPCLSTHSSWFTKKDICKFPDNLRNLGRLQILRSSWYSFKNSFV